MRTDSILVFSNALSYAIETVCAYSAHCDQVVCWPEAANGEVAAVLDRLVAAGGRHVLRHGGDGGLD